MTHNRIYLCLAHMSDVGLEQKYIQDAFDTNWVVPLGPNVNGFEKDLEDYVGQGKRVVALSSGTAAVHLALVACGVGPSDEVLVQSFTFCASSHPVTYLGATPVFIDSEKNSWNMDPELLEKAIQDRIAKKGKKPKAIIPVALYGMPYQIERIMEIANRYDIPVIEDAAEAFGSRWKGQVLGTFGKYGVLSFNGNKMITTSGGGALICGPTPVPSPEGKGPELPRGIHTADKNWYGVLKEYAQENRKNPTVAETALWNALRGKGIGEKFRQQHIIDDFIVDFFCQDKGLIIEVDGGYHNYPPQMKKDVERTWILSKLGYVEIRFTNEEVLHDLDGVLRTITNFCQALPSRSHPLGGEREGAEAQWQEIMMYATQYRESYPYYQHEKIGYNYRMSNICAGIGRGQMTIANDHINHHKHIQNMYEELLGEVPGIQVHAQPATGAYDSNYWLCTITLDPKLKIKGQENAYKTLVQGAVGGAASVIHKAESATTDCQPNDNVEALRVYLDQAGIEARPLWKPMHKQPVYKDAPAYVNGVSEAIFKVGMCLPSGPCVSDDDVRYIVGKILEAII